MRYNMSPAWHIACITKGRVASDHTYQYAPTFGDTTVIVVEYDHYDTLNLPPIKRLKFGSAYNYGMTEPHYPVPALRGWNNTVNPKNSGGVKNDCVCIGAYYVDWSRGTIEVY